jgi:hypothetical protein
LIRLHYSNRDEGSFLIFVTECKGVGGKIDGHEIYNITETAFIPLSNVDTMDSLEKQNLEKSYQEFRKWLNTNGFYFSYTFDITNSMQKGIDKTKTAPFSIESSFFWNSFISQYFKNNKLHEWILPIMKGYIRRACCRFLGRDVEMVLISRISSHR